MKLQSDLPVCGISHVDRQHEEQIRARMPGESEAVDVAAVFTQLADATRVRILCMLASGELCVCEMADILGMSQPAVSHHLRVLRQFDAIRFRKSGQRTVYDISDNQIGETIRRLLEVAGCGKE
jgi:ArsR family transcriptional regulator, lead/cadmium/zinc/bismuth-responsive transcriptional repressor